MNLVTKFAKITTEDGLSTAALRSLRFLATRSRLVGDQVELRRILLARQVFGELNGRVAHGPLAGFKLSDDASWSAGSRAAMLLGFYELEVLTSLVSITPPYRTLIDVGAADGYYGVGLVWSGVFDRSYCFEISPRGQRVINSVAAENDVQDRISVLGEATTGSILSITNDNVNLNESVFLFDIEGREFDLITPDLLYKLKDSIIFIELHDKMLEDGDSKLNILLSNARKHHILSKISSGSRNPNDFPELLKFPENDRWLICSEGRRVPQVWLRLDPRQL